MDVQSVLAARAAILDQAGGIATSLPGTSAGSAAAPGFGAQLEAAMRGVAESQNAAGAASAAYERGDTNDIAAVQLARQAAAVDFQATLQVRNRVLSAYRDIMNMGV